MDSSNANNDVGDDNLDVVSNFTDVSSIGMDIGQLTEKMQEIKVAEFSELILIS